MRAGIVDGLRDFAAAAVASSRCLLCEGSAAQLICEGCSTDLPWNFNACGRCALPLPIGMSLCAVCARRPPPFDATLAAFRYEPPVDGAILRLKYGADFLAARWLAEALAARLRQAEQPKPDLILPMPLHRGRLARRGYNQAQEIARLLAKRLALPLMAHAGRRIRATEDQIGKSAIERRRNLRGAFTVDACVSGKSIAIVDDVLTTGSTAAELARICRLGGATRVEIWVLARAV